MSTHSRISPIVVTIVGILVAARNIHNCAAQTALNLDDLIVPNPDLLLGSSTTGSISFRNNFCDLQLRNQLDDGSIKLRHALKGQNVTVHMLYDQSHVNYLNKEDENGFKFINPDDPGILINIMDEVARRAKFSWRDSWHWMKPPTAGNTWTDLLIESTNTFDISAGWFYDSIDRIGLGLAFPTGWYDGDLIIIDRDSDEPMFLGGTTLSPFNWSQPFTVYVWGFLVLTIIITGLVAILVQDNPSYRDAKIEAPATQGRKKGSMISSYLLKSFGAFTGNIDLFPKTHAGYILTFSLAFFAMIINAAYTANLASFLVIQQEAYLNQVNTVNDIVRMHRSMCVTDGSAVMQAVKDVHSEAQFVQISGGNTEDVLKALYNLECDYAIVGVAAWEESRGISEVNPECDLSRIGRTFKQAEAGFVTKSDAGTLCTSLVRDVINIHFEEMIEDGFIDDQWEKSLKKKHDVTDPSCLNSAPAEKDSNILGMENLGGIFLFHFVLVLSALFLAYCNRCICKRNSSPLPHNSSDEEHIPNTRTSYQNKTSTSNVHNSEVLSERIDHLSKTMNDIVKLLTPEDCEVIDEN